MEGRKREGGRGREDMRKWMNEKGRTRRGICRVKLRQEKTELHI